MPQAQSVAIPKPWPLHAPLETRTSEAPFTKDSRLINGYAERTPGGQFDIYKRVGLGQTPFFSPSQGGNGLGIYTETGAGTVWFVTGSTLFAGSPLFPPGNISTVDGSAPYFFETVSNTLPRFVVMGNGAKAYYSEVVQTISGIRGFFTQITDPAFPTSFVQGWVYINGFLYIMDTLGNIWGTLGTNNPAAWSALNVIKASSNADLGVGLAKQLNYLIAFKQYTTQVFYDAGNPPPGSPLSVVQDSQIPFGCIVGTSIASIDNSILWLTSNETISPQIAQLDNLVPKIVSTPAIDRILDNITWTSAQNNIRAWTLKHAGHRFYILNLISNNMTLVYDLDQKLWYPWQDFQGNFWPIVSAAFVAPAAGAQGIHLAQHATNGNIYPLDGDYAFPNDYGNVFPVDVYTPNFTGSTSRRKTINMLYFDADRTAGSILKVRRSDDDYRSWSNFRDVDLNRKKPSLRNEGTFDLRRAYHLRHMCNTTFRIRSMFPQMDIGTI